MAQRIATRRKNSNNNYDGGLAWIVVIASFFSHAIVFGITSSFIAIIPQLDEFKYEREYIKLIISLLTALPLCTGPISSFLVNYFNKYGCRFVTVAGSILASACLLITCWAQNITQFFIIIGFGVGCSLGFVYFPAIVSVIAYFEKYRSLAVGIVTSGSELGVLILKPQVAYFKELYGWRVTLLILCVVVLHCVIFGALLGPLGPLGPTTKTVPEYHHSIFVLFAISVFSTSVGCYAFYTWFVDLATELGVSLEEASHLIWIIGIVNTISRIIWGFISDKTGLNRLWIYNISIVVWGIATIACAFCNNYETLIIYSVVFGISIGAYFTLRFVILVDLLGLDKFNNALGLLLLFEGIASLIGPPIVGFLYDHVHSSIPGFQLAGVIITLSGFMLFFIPILQRNIAKNNVDLEMT